MTTSINCSDSDSIKQMMALMFQKMKAADADGTSGLSKSELSSIDAGEDFGGADFLKSLNAQFDSLDADGNGQLSTKEIASAKPLSGPMGPPPGLNITSDEDSTDLTGSVATTKTNDTTASAASTGDLLASLLEKLLKALSDSYPKGDDSSSSNAGKATSLVSSSDTDKSGGLSLDELKSVNTRGNTGKAGFVNDLVSNFSKYDTDSDGNLSQSEILASMPKEFSQQNIAGMSGSSSSDSGNTLSNLTAFMGKLMNSYKDSGALSSIASTSTLFG